MKSTTRLLTILLVMLMTACAGDRAHRQGMNLIAEGKVEEGLAKLEEAAKSDPDQLRFRMDLQAQRGLIVGRLLTAAAKKRTAGQIDAAETLYRRVLTLEPGSERATAGLEAIARERRHRPLLDEAAGFLSKGDPEAAQSVLRSVESETPNSPELLELKRQIADERARQEHAVPVLKSAGGKTINMEFRDANVKIIFEALSRAAGVNFILDRDVRPDMRTTVFLRQATVEDAIELLLQTNRLEKKVLNSNTVLIYPNTPEKRKDYQELVVKGIYLANADVKQTQAMLKEILKIREMFIDEKLGLLVIRDTPEAVRMAERLIAMLDLSEPEVMLEVEVMEVKRTRLMELGIQWPTQLTLAPLASGSALTAYDLDHLNSSRVGATLSNTAINLRRDLTDANILANPRIRARNRETAKILIGDKVPVINSTSTATGFVSESTQYLDVGLKLEVEPRVTLQDDVVIKIGLEVSSIVKEVLSKNGTLTYQIGTRNASTTLRLKDGETQVLAGLISDEDRSAASRVPGIGDLPIVGRLFGSQKDDRQKTEIVLSITPRIIRNLVRPDAHAGEFWSGTDTLLRSRPLRMAENGTVESVSVPAVAMTDDNVVADSGAAEVRNLSEAGASVVVLRWEGPSEVRVGEQFAVSLQASTERPLRSLPFQLSFDPSALQMIGVTEGAFFGQAGGKVGLSSQTDPNGRVFVGVASAAADGVRGEGSVATLRFRAVAAKPRAEMRLIAVTPVVAGAGIIGTQLPGPHVVTIRP